MFDPYHKWLGIPQTEQPPNHYRLLGIQLFENDEDVIASAADRQMVYVKSFAGGPSAADAQKLLNELAKARVCLLNTTAKETYDAELRRMIEQATDGQNAVPDAIASVSARAEFVAATTPPTARKTTPPGGRFASSGAMIPADQSPAMPAVQVSAANMASQRASRLQSEKRRWRIRMFGHLVFSCFGLAIAYVLLAYIGPQFDFLNLFNRPGAESVQSSPLEIDGNSSSPSLPGSSPLQNEHNPSKHSPNTQLPNGSNPVLEPGSLANEPIAETIESSDPELEEVPAGHTAATASSDPIPNTGPAPDNQSSSTNLWKVPFSSLPFEMDLPSFEEEQMRIGPVYLPIGTPLALRIIPADNPHRLAFKFHALPVATGDVEQKWAVYYAEDEKMADFKGGSGNLEAIAEFRVAEGTLSLHWLPAARQTDWQKMGNCLVELGAGAAQHIMQMRRVITDEPICIEDSDSPLALNITLEYLPATTNLFLEVSHLENFPPLQPFQGDPERIPENELTIWGFAGTDYAGLGIQWERRGNHISIRVAPGYQLESEGLSRIVLGSSDLARREKIATKNLKDWSLERIRRVNSRSALDRQLIAARNFSVRGSSGAIDFTLLARRRQAIQEAQARINGNDARILFLEDKIPKLTRDLARVPKLKEFATLMEGHATVGLRLYSLAAGHRIVLYTNDRADRRESNGAPAAGTP